MTIRGLSAALLCVALGGPSAAFAQSGGASSDLVPTLPSVAPEADALAGVGAREVSAGDPDDDATLAALADNDRRGLEAIGEHEAALRKVLADMPRPFVRERVEGDHVVYRGDSMADCLAFAATLKAGPDGKRAFVCRGNPYAVAAFYLGAYLNEARRYDEARAVLDLGVEASPTSPGLISERNAAFFALHQFDEALAATQRELAIPNLAPNDRARLLRNLGNALTALRRLDEARRAYEDSLQLEPGNALALNELRYITQLQNGGAPAPGVVFRPNAPRKPAAP